MAVRRVRVLGGGPAGLLAARLIALDHPDWDIRLFERLPPDDTFGFGVGLTGGLLRALETADPEVHRRVQAAAHPFHSAEFRMPEGRAQLAQFHSGAIGRARLLRELTAAAADAGVRIEVGSAVSATEVGDADLVIAADGVGSPTRTQRSAEFGAEVSEGRGAFIWCGAPIELPGTVFTPVQTPAGLFVAHSYPYAPGRSTFVIEASPETLSRAGLGRTEWTSDDESDEESLHVLSEAFTDLLGGAAFDGNRSRWTRFTTVRCARWHHTNTVLLGDAAATAHPSLGSGTKLALESAIALARSLRDGADRDIASALADFDRVRRPAVEALQDRATRSQFWWESFESRLNLTPARVAVAYLTRAGAVSLDDLVDSAPDLAARAVADYAGTHPDQVPERGLTKWVLDCPLAVDDRRFTDRIVSCAGQNGVPVMDVDGADPWGDLADQYLEQARSAATAGSSRVRLTGDGGRLATLDRFAVAERIRNEVGVLVEVACPREQLADAADALVSGRTDLVAVTD